MKKSIKVTPKKKRGRPATGRDPHVTSRMPPQLVAEVEAWASANETSRSDAFRRLVERALASEQPSAPRSEKKAAKAKELAAAQIDRLADKSAPAEEQASRKRRLLKGPEEFCDVRVDRPKAK
jgi:Arc/MetJ-type ribon-helix-helix transcriptional regulator